MSIAVWNKMNEKIAALERRVADLEALLAVPLGREPVLKRGPGRPAKTEELRG